jgi:hypothetical protein
MHDWKHSVLPTKNDRTMGGSVLTQVACVQVRRDSCLIDRWLAPFHDQIALNFLLG